MIFEPGEQEGQDHITHQPVKSHDWRFLAVDDDEK